MRRSTVSALALLSGALLSNPAQAQECVVDDDCDEGYTCELDDVARADCASGSECDDIAIEPSGWCEPTPFVCEADSDCPAPAECDVEEGECVYTIEFCEADSECDPNYECLAAGGPGMCSSGVSSDSDGEPKTASASSGGGDAASGSEDTGAGEASEGGGDGDDPAADAPPRAGGAAPPADEAAEPPIQTPDESAADEEAAAAEDVAAEANAECEDEVTVSYCFPKVFACETDDDCMDDWTCEEVPDGGPDEWENVERACLPPVIVAVIEERIQVDGGGSSQDDSSTDGRGVDEEEESQDPSSNGDAEDGDIEAEDATIPLGTQGGSEGSSSCAATNARPHSRLGWVLAVLGLAWTFRRRNFLRTR